MICKAIRFLMSITYLGYASGIALPDYVTACSRNDPNLNDCALQSAKKSIHQYALGDTSRNLKPLDPLYVAEMIVYVPNEQGLKLVFKDNMFSGLSDLVLTGLRFDLDKKLISAEAIVNLSVQSKYDLTGKILIVPVDSSGDATIKLKNTTLQLRIWYEHQQNPDGIVYWKITKHDLKYDVGRAIFRLENLLNDKNIGDQINKLLNELWRDIITEVGPAIAQSLSAAVVDSVGTLLDQVPYDLLLPPQ